MPGGSNSGRPFREDPTSYSRTGIPCGNPKRYASRGVIRMAPDGTPYRDQRIEAPLEDIETEGDRQLQALLKKQLNTQVTLHDQLSQKKSFTDGTVYKPLPVMGTLSLDRFRHLDEQARQVEDLRQLGLSEEEIHLKLGLNDKDEEDARSAKRPRLGANPSVLQEKLAAIEEKIAKKKEMLAKPDTFAGTKEMSRHEMDLEKAISHDREKAKLLGILMSSQKMTNTAVDPNDPINHLDDIWEEALEAKRIEKKRDKKSDFCKGCGKPIIDGVKSSTSDNIGEDHFGKYTEGCVLCLRRQVLNCDIEGPLSKEQMILMKSLEVGQELSDTEIKSGNNDLICPKTQDRSERQMAQEQENVLVSGHFHESSTHGTSCPDLATEPRELTRKVEIIPEEVIRKYRLKVDQIRKLPRFQNYSPGEPTKTLYLKNLSSRVEESDLVALFHRFQAPDGASIVYKLMTGRMRGQAFVTFDDVETATKALELVNGYDFKGKHIIIQYGRKDKDSTALTQKTHSAKTLS